MAKPKGLDVKTIDAAKPRAKAYRLGEAGGLLLEVKPSGAKVWMCRLTIAGKRRDMGLGGYPAISLREARAAARSARERAAAQADPIRERERAQQEAREAAVAAAEAEARTFRSVAELCVKAMEPGWKNVRTAEGWRQGLEDHVYPVLGRLPVDQVDRAAVLRAISGVWPAHPSTARKVLPYIATILRFAAAHSWRLNDNPADPKMLKHMGLPALPGTRKHPSLPWPKVPAFIAALRKLDDVAALALEFGILNISRSVEVRGARWPEISFDGVPTWTVPAERMKQKRSATPEPHRIPLTAASLDVLARAYSLASRTEVTAAQLPKLVPLRGDILVFPSSKKGVQLAPSTMAVLIHDMNAARPEGTLAPWRDPDGREAVPHGFRASFRTWVDDTRPQDAAAAECAMAHEEPNRAVGAYRRSDLFDRRIPLMADWAAHCTSGSAGSVVSLPATATQ